MTVLLNCHEILIFGGFIEDKEEEDEEERFKPTNGILTFNTSTNEYKEVVKDSFCINSPFEEYKAAVQLYSDKVLAVK